MIASATLRQLLRVRSTLIDEVIGYLDALAVQAAELPPYYPAHLHSSADGRTHFCEIRQMVQVVEDRRAFEKWIAEERERSRAAGLDIDHLAYDPGRSQSGGRPADRQDAADRKFTPPSLIPWDERAGDRFKRAVVLGDPGFGKTWLLRYEGHRLAQEGSFNLRERSIALDGLLLPIFARLSDLTHSDLPMEESFLVLTGGGRSKAFQRLVTEKLHTDRCVLLLDAWDEVPVEQPIDGQPITNNARYRQRLGQRLQAFARAFPKPRMFITSRIVGYTGPPIPGAKEVELVSFEAHQQEAFARQWFGERSEKAKQFLSLLRQSPQVRGLARIPLLLALICRAYEEEHLTFPTRRADLYDRCMRGLLRDWRQEKEQREIGDDYLEALLELLRETSYALLTDGYEQFSDIALRAKMLPFLNAIQGTHELYGRSPASVIAELKLAGILVTAGRHRGAPLLFLHRTFQEFLAAGALASRNNGVEEALRHVYDPAWQEALYVLGGLLAHRTLSYIHELLKKNEEDLAFRPFQLALGAAAEANPDDLPSEISSALVKALAAFYCLANYSSRVLFLDIDRRLLPLLIAWGERAVPHLVSNPGFYDWEFGFANPASARALGQIASVKALPRLWSLLLLGRPAYDAAAAANAIAKIGAVSGGTLSSMINILEKDGLRRVVMQILAENPDFLGRSPGRTEPGLWPLELEGRIQFLPDVRAYVAAALSQSEVSQALSDDAVPVLISVLEDASRQVSESVASQTLWASVAEILVGLAPEEVAPYLLSGLKSKSADRRMAAVTLLTRAKGHEAIPHLLECIADPDGGVRSAVADALGVATLDEMHARELLLHENWQVREVGAILAGTVGRVGALSELVRLLSDVNECVRGAAAKSLGQIGSAEIVPCLVALLRDESHDVREAAVEALGKAGTADTVPLLVPLLDEPQTREIAVQALGGIGSESVCAYLLPLLRDQESRVRTAVVRALGKIGSRASECHVIAALHDEDIIVRHAALEALQVIGSAQAVPELLAFIRDDKSPALNLDRAGEALGEILHREKMSIPRLLAPVTKRYDEYYQGHLQWIQNEVQSIRNLARDALVKSDEIAQLAHSYWQARGGQGGSPDDDWLRAEEELLANRRQGKR